MLAGFTHPLTSVFGIGTKATNQLFSLRAFARLLLKETTAAVFMVAPGDKIPIDMRGPVVKSNHQRTWLQAREALWDLGIELPEIAPAGLHLATRDPETLTSWITAYRKQFGEECAVNFGLEVGRSNLVVVDIDTAAEMAAFKSHWLRAAAENPAAEAVAYMQGCPGQVCPPDPEGLLRAVSAAHPLVETPGKQKGDEWVHKDGGHFYFLPPPGLALHTPLSDEVNTRLRELGIGPDHPMYTTIAMVADPLPGHITVRGSQVPHDGEPHSAGYSVFWRSRYLVMPPSVREEGAYRTTRGDIYGCPTFLATMISDKLAATRTALAERATGTRHPRPRPAPTTVSAPTNCEVALPDPDAVITAADPRMRWVLQTPPRPLQREHLAGWTFSRAEAAVLANKVGGPAAARRVMALPDPTVAGDSLFDSLRVITDELAAAAVIAAPSPGGRPPNPFATVPPQGSIADHDDRFNAFIAAVAAHQQTGAPA